MKFFLLFCIFIFCVNQTLYSQNKTIGHFAGQGYNIKVVKSFNDLKKIINTSNLPSKTVIYIKKENYIQGFLFVEDGELPNFFVAKDSQFWFFLSDNYSEGPDFYNSILLNLYSVYQLEYKNSSVYYINVSSLFPTSLVYTNMDIYEFRKNKCIESTAKMYRSIIMPNFQDTLLNHANFNLIDEAKIEKIKIIKKSKINKNLKPSILIMLNQLYKFNLSWRTP